MQADVPLEQKLSRPASLRSVGIMDRREPDPPPFGAVFFLGVGNIESSLAPDGDPVPFPEGRSGIGDRDVIFTKQTRPDKRLRLFP